jgi:Holliday junction resolvasome RuvABC endonuclease subunit
MIKAAIMGLDISSSTIGYSIIRNGKLEDYGYLKPNDKYDEFQQLQLICNILIEKAKEYEIDNIAIEKIAEYFGKGSTSKTIVKLAKWNGVISYAMFNEGFNISHHNVISIRSCIRKEYNIKNKTEIKKLAKEEVPHFVSDLLGFDFEFEYNSKGKLKMENYDKSDAVAVALYSILEKGNKIK